MLEAWRGRVHGAVPLFFRLEMEQNKLTSTSTLTLLHQTKEIEKICIKGKSLVWEEKIVGAATIVADSRV